MANQDRFTNTLKHGRRAHTIGSFFPFRVMVQGTLDNLKYIVINPDGTKMDSCDTSKAACEMAELMYHFSLIG